MIDDEKERPLNWSPPRRPTPRRGLDAPLQVYSADERAGYLPAVKPVRLLDASKKKVRREEREVRQLGGGLGAYSKAGKTARDRAKPKSGKKTNDPSLSQKARGTKGQK